MTKICCMNCCYFWKDPREGFCNIDDEIIPEPLEEIKFCPAFEEWWGAVE